MPNINVTDALEDSFNRNLNIKDELDFGMRPEVE
jgi:hypothetical protein